MAALAERSELATDGGGSEARSPSPAVAWQSCSPCSTRRTHFPRWLGSAEESVGISGEGGRKLPPSVRGNHSTVKDALHPGTPVTEEEMWAAIGKSSPLGYPSPTRAKSGGRMLEEAERVIQVYGLAREEGVHNVFLPTRLPEVCKILVRRRVE